MPSPQPAKPWGMMSLPPLVMVVWVWPLVHVTICALLGSPEASNLASSHDIYTLTHFHNETISDAVKCFNTPEGFWLCPYICAHFNTSPPRLLFQSCCTASPLLSFTRWLCSRVARRKGAEQGEAQAQRSLMYGFWRGNTAQAMRECGNVRMAWCPLGPAHCALCLEGAFLLVPGGCGMKEGTRGLVGRQAWDQTAERQ